MSSHDLPPLSPTLRALVEAERGNVSADPARAASVLAATEGVIALGVGAAVGITAAAAASTGAGAGVKASAAAAAKAAISISTGKVVGIAVIAFALGTGVGIGVDRALAPPQAALHVDAPVVTPMTIAPPHETPQVGEPVVAAPPSASVSATHAPPAASASPPPATASAAPRGRGDLAQEQAIIDAARAGLASGRNEDVIVAVDRHAQSFPRGQFSEERDAMRILALARLGRSSDARQRADQFRSAYPSSALLPKVEAAVR